MNHGCLTKPKSCLTTVLLLLSALLLSACERQQATQIEQQYLEFGTVISVTMISRDRAVALSLLKQIENDLKRWRGYWHAWEDSDLTRFNSSLKSRGAASIPDSLRELLELSQLYYDRSDGLFNPAMGQLIGAWGFHGRPADMEKVKAITEDIPGMDDLLIDGDLATSGNPWIQVDLGGIAKGLAVRNIAQLLRDNGIVDFIVNAGGDLQVSGKRFDRPWRLGIRNPFAPGIVAAIELEGNTSLFTSGNYERFFKKGGGSVHHIIDPVTGQPSKNVSSATVLAADPVLADVAATVLMVDGLRQPQALMAKLGITEYLIIDGNKQLFASDRMAQRLQSVDETRIVVLN